MADENTTQPVEISEIEAKDIATLNFNKSCLSPFYPFYFIFQSLF